MVEKDEKEKKVRRPGTWGFAINDCPIWIWRKFDALAKRKFLDQYWVTLHDQMMKAEAYDNMVMEGMIEPEEPKVEKKEEGVVLLGGNKGVSKKGKGD